MVEDKSKQFRGHRERLRERFNSVGLQGFSDHEVLELVLTLAIPRKDVKLLAKRLLARFGTLSEVFDSPVQDLLEVEGIGKAGSTALKIIRESGTLYLQKRAEDVVVLDSPEALEKFWLSRLSGHRNEVFEVAFLDSAFRLIRNGVERLQEGTIDRAVIYPRRVIESALQRGVPAIVLAHNHPNGTTEPSEEDKLLTKAIIQASCNLDIKILDHLIIGDGTIFSFRKEGLL